MVDITITVANIDWVSGPKETRDASETLQRRSPRVIASTPCLQLPWACATAQTPQRMRAWGLP